MSNGDDQQQECCAAMICCDEEKADAALAKQLHGLSPEEAAAFLHAHYDMVPKAAGLGAFIRYIQAHPYR